MIVKDDQTVESPYLKMAIQTVLVRYMDQWDQVSTDKQKQQQLLTAMSREIMQRAKHMEALAEQTYASVGNSYTDAY